MDITSIIAVLGAMSLSVERVVEMIKSMWPWLAKTQPAEKDESHRRAVLHLLAAAVGAVIAYVSQGQLQPLLANIFKAPGVIGIPGCIIIGLLASGGSGFWNQSLSIVEEIKKAKKIEVQKMQKANP